MNYKPIVIVAGEPNSVFSEIFCKAKIKYRCRKPIILIASKNNFLKQVKKLKYSLKIKQISENKNDISKLSNKSINLINVDYKFEKTFDKMSNRSNDYISKCFGVALNILKENDCAGFINGPISKKNFLGNRYLGITEYLASKTIKKKVAMLIYNKKLSVSPLTTHLPLKDVHKHITKEKIINQVKLIKEFYKKQFKKNPKIAITGLNPHCESNYKSSEETNIIKPAINYLIRNKYNVKGPYSADTIFMENHSQKFDVILGMYHDQVLTPVKTIFGFNAVNITLGLPFIRISPDHGPNTPMLGKNKSDATSLIKALKFFDK